MILYAYRPGQASRYFTSAYGLYETGPTARVALPKLFKLAEHEHATTRERAGMALAKLAPEAPRTVAVLIRLISDPTPSVRDQAMHYLRQCDQKNAQAAVPALIKSLDEDSYIIRNTAISTLGALAQPSPEVTKAITPLLQDPKSREAATSALAELRRREGAHISE